MLQQFYLLESTGRCGIMFFMLSFWLGLIIIINNNIILTNKKIERNNKIL
jgi:hypothetical protein